MRFGKGPAHHQSSRLDPAQQGNQLQGWPFQHRHLSVAQSGKGQKQPVVGKTGGISFPQAQGIQLPGLFSEHRQ